LGFRVSEEFIDTTERAILDDESFARERLGIWHEDESSSIIDRDQWVALADPKSQALDPVAFAVETNWERSWSTVAMGGWRQDGRLHGEVVEHRRGTGWVVPRMVELKKHRPHRVTLDPGGPAGALLVPLNEAGVEVDPVSTRELVQACGALVDDVANGGFRHLDQPELNAAVFAATTRTVGDAWAWQRRSTQVDVSPLVAVTLARWAASQRPQRATPLGAWR
jgi:hypothetical protein